MKKSSEEKEREQLQSFKERAYSRPATPLERETYGADSVAGVRGGNSQLVLSRLRRCQNCFHWDQGEAFNSAVKHCIARDNRSMLMAGTPKRQVDLHLSRLHRTLASGEYGFCLVRDRRKDSAASADFSHLYSRCEEWSGHVGADGQPDPEAQEIYDRVQRT